MAKDEKKTDAKAAAKSTPGELAKMRAELSGTVESVPVSQSTKQKVAAILRANGFVQN